MIEKWLPLFLGDGIPLRYLSISGMPTRSIARIWKIVAAGNKMPQFATGSQLPTGGLKTHDNQDVWTSRGKENEEQSLAPRRRADRLQLVPTDTITFVRIIC